MGLAQTQPLYASRIGLEHLKFKTGRMPHDLSALRQTAEQGDDQTAESIHLLVLLPRLKVDAGLLAKIFQIHSGVGLPSTVGKCA